MASAVVGDHAVALGQEEQHLCIPVVGAERPAMVKHDWLTGAPGLVEDFGAVGGGERVMSLGPCFLDTAVAA